jgi:hypothetical protein
MKKKSHRLRHRSFKLNKPVDQLEEEELALLADALPPDHPMLLTIMHELERRMRVLIDDAPSLELKQLMEEAADPATVQRFLQATGRTEMLDSVAQHGSAALTEQAVHLINGRQRTPVVIHAADVWNAWPPFVAEVYGGQHPEDLLHADRYLNDFIHWMITNKNQEFYRTVGHRVETAWLRTVAEICVNRRILEWKYIGLSEYGRDTFADPETRERVLRMAESGQFQLWKEGSSGPTEGRGFP